MAQTCPSGAACELTGLAPRAEGSGADELQSRRHRAGDSGRGSGPDRGAVSGDPLSYAQLDALSDRLAAGLESAGVRPGDMVGLQLPNIPQFLIAYFGILKCGGVAVPLNVHAQGARSGLPPH